RVEESRHAHPRRVGAAEEMVDMAVRFDIAISERAPVGAFGDQQDAPVRAAGEEAGRVRHRWRPGGDLRRAAVKCGDLTYGRVEQAGERGRVGRAEAADT